MSAAAELGWTERSMGSTFKGRASSALTWVVIVLVCVLLLWLWVVSTPPR